MSLDFAATWRDVQSRVGFYTFANRGAIPEGAGVYAWFCPLWLFSEDLGAVVGGVQAILDFDAPADGKAERECYVDFNWERVALSVSKSSRARLTDEMYQHWESMKSTDGLRDVFQRTLMEASVFLPPLYVGHADALRTRYDQHASGSTGFAERFQRNIERTPEGVPRLGVSDLVFACIEMNPLDAGMVRKHNLHLLLEQVAMRLARPPYSSR
ncbi:MAG: hypothetical protein NTY35_00060 [Planctomycetota bacterium]|nr:hypothetical protein [Planctomycetota bacterium]